MSAITEQANYSLQQTADGKTLAKLIAPLFASLHSQNTGSTTKAVLDNYLDVISDVDPSALGQVVDEYRRGLRGDGRFVPPAAELAKAARSIVEARKAMEREQFQRQKQKEAIAKEIADNERWRMHREGITQESRDRVQARLDEHKARQAEIDLEERNRKSLSDCPSIWEQAAKRFNEEGRQSLLKTLGEQE